MDSNFVNFTPISTESGGREIENLETAVAVCLAVAIANLCVTLWIVISMVVYGIRKIRRRNERHRRLYYVCLTAVVLTLPRLVLHLVMLNELRYPGILGDCEVIMDICHVSGAFVIYVTYFFLWLRHRETFQHPALKKVPGGKYLTMLSWGTILVLTILALILVCGYTIPGDYVLTKTGCNDEYIVNGGGDFASWSMVRSFVTAACMFLVQSSLIFLFVYPLIKNKHRPRNLSKKSASNRDKIMATIRRLVVSAVAASLTDFVVVVGVFVWVEVGGYPPAITDTLLNLDPLINCICILATFKSHKDILLVFCRHQTLDKVGSSQVNSTSSIRIGDSRREWNATSSLPVGNRRVSRLDSPSGDNSNNAK